MEKNTKTGAMFVISSVFDLGTGQGRTTVSTLPCPSVHTWQRAGAVLLTAALACLDYSDCSAIHNRVFKKTNIVHAIIKLCILCPHLVMSFIPTHTFLILALIKNREGGGR